MLYYRPMGVSKNTNVRLNSLQKCPSLIRERPALIHNVTDRDTVTAKIHDGFAWEPAPFILVDVAGHRDDGGDLSKPVDHSPIADVACVNDPGYTGKMPLNRSVK